MLQATLRLQVTSIPTTKGSLVTDVPIQRRGDSDVFFYESEYYLASTMVVHEDMTVTALPYPKTLAVYQTLASNFNVSKDQPIEAQNHCLQSGLLEELGEVAGKLKRQIRGDSPNFRQEISKELGDVLWYLAELATMNDHALTVGTVRLRHNPYRTHAAAMKMALHLCRYPSQASVQKLLTILAELAYELLQKPLIYIAATNLEKLHSRWRANTILGSGDSR
jgi:NTP pyrophosphatase (non-canonical NTP hydrolase)